jgi:hypothetical protein
MEQPFYVGQEVVALRDSLNAIGDKCFKGQTYIVQSMKKCSCGSWHVDIGCLSTYVADAHCPCGRLIKKKTRALYGSSKFFAPIERAKTKYVIKEVEVAPQIRELEVCQS